MIFADYESFVMLSWVLSMPAMVIMSLVLVVVAAYAAEYPRLSTLYSVVLGIAVILAVVLAIELVHGVILTSQAASPNSKVLPTMKDGMFTWVIFLSVYIGPVVYASFVLYMLQRRLAGSELKVQ